MGFRGSSYTGSSKAKSSGSKKSSSSNKTSSSGGSNQPVSSKRFYVPKQIKEKKTKKVEKTKGQKQVEAQQNKNKIQKDKDKDKQGILSAIGHGPVQKGYIGDDAFKKGIPAGQHKLRSQFDRLSAKYGPDFAKTSQGQHLLNYLSGVSVERGGGLGARDPSYGGSAENIDPELEAERQRLLAKISAMGTPFDTQDIGTLLADVERTGLGKDLSSDQWFNFRQQLMAADPSAGNVAYKEAFPWASGNILKAASGLVPGIGALKAVAKSAAGAMGKLIPPELRTMGRDVFDAAGKLIPPELGIMGRDVFDAAGKLIPEDAKTMFRDARTAVGGIGDFFKSNPPAEYMGTAADPDFLAAMRGRSIEPSDDPKTRYTGLGSFTGEEPWVGDRSADEYRQQVSYGAGIPSLYGGPIQDPFNPGAGDDPTFKPGVDPDNPWGIPAQYAGFYDSPFNIPNQGASAAVVTPVTLPSGETINFGNPYIADQFQQYMASQTQTPAAGVASLAPTTIDYASMAPQFGSQYPGYKNQGLAALMERENPQLGDWYQNLNRYYT